MAEDHSVAKGFVAGGTFINHKAGVDGVDKDKVSKLVFEMSKDSAFFKNEQRKVDATNRKIAEMSGKLENSDFDREALECSLEQKITHLEV